MTTEKKISRLCHWMSFLLRMKDFKTIFKKLEKGPPPAIFSDPTCPKIWVFSFVVHDSDNFQD